MKKASHSIGESLANIQAIFDDLFQFIFNNLKDIKEEEKAKKPETTLEHGVHYLKKGGKFLGEVGEAFYEKYNKIKAEDAEKKK